ncbi:MAG: hypothetical protein OXN17_14515 [Candidatus Poribacteria bacterium]|nr:hypothetical protein [Candidatus Poribacteria bacterium]
MDSCRVGTAHLPWRRILLTPAECHVGGAAKGGISLYARGLVDGVVGGVGVEFLGKVIVFALHLISEVVDAVVDIRIHLTEPGIYIGVKIVDAFVKIADLTVHIGESRIHIGVQIVYPLT